MQITRKIFFSLIRIAMGEEYDLSSDGINLSEELKNPERLAKVCAVAELHDMVHLVSAALQKLNISPENPRLADAITKEELKAIFRVDRLDAEFEAVCSLLEENAIPYIPLKGSVLRSLYPQRWFRVSCDIDILIKEADCKKASKLLSKQLEYTLGKKSERDVSFFTPSGVHIELHFRLADEESLEGLTDLAWETAQKHDGAKHRYSLSPEVFSFYHMAHAAKHLRHGGCGAKAILDVWVMLKQSEFVFDGRNSLIARQNLLKFSDSVTTLASVWFGNACHNELTQELERYILMGGAYGNLDNAISVEQTKEKGTFAFFLSKIFLPTEKLKNQYPILYKHIWLLPFCHLLRWFKLIFCSRKRIAENIKAFSSIDDTKIESTAKLLSDLELKP